MQDRVRVGILEDHQSVIDGYLYRLKDYSDIDIVFTINYGDALMPSLEAHPLDVLILDINTPLNADNNAVTPILYLIPTIRKRFPDVALLIISMLAERALIRSVLNMGTHGYILKDDYIAIRRLGSVIHSVASGGAFFSKQVNELLQTRAKRKATLTPRQIEVMNLLAAYPHLTTSQIATELNVAHSTVRNLLSDVYVRLDVPNRSAALDRSRQLGIIPARPEVTLKRLMGDE